VIGHGAQALCRYRERIFKDAVPGEHAYCTVIGITCTLARTMNDDSNPTDDTRPLRPEEQDPRHWKDDGWAARIVKNEDGDGWAVEMTRDGENEPALVGPWTMGRDKISPKPLDTTGFRVLVKAANDVRARHQQQLHAQLHRSITATGPNGERMRVDLDVVPDEDDPHAILTVFDDAGEVATRSRVQADFKLTAQNVRSHIARGGEPS
jgi:hypothetical protein